MNAAHLAQGLLAPVVILGRRLQLLRNFRLVVQRARRNDGQLLGRQEQQRQRQLTLNQEQPVAPPVIKLRNSVCRKA